MTLQREPDCQAVVVFLPTEDGGRPAPVSSGYRPHHAVREDLLTTGLHEYLDTDLVHPGESARANIVLLTPEQYPKCLWVGRILQVQEGTHLVARAKITHIFNPTLDRDADST